MAKGTFYQHFSSKEQYLYALIEKLHRDVFALARQTIFSAHSKDSGLPEKVRGAFSSASDGQLLPPVLLEGNPVIFKLHSTGDAPALTLEQAAPRIEEMLKEPRMQERFTEYAQQLRAKAVIDIRM